MDKYNLKGEFKIKKNRGFSLNELTIYSIIIICLIALTFNSFNNNSKQAVDSEFLKSRAILIDRSLSSWYQTHGGKYPSTLNVLQVVELLPADLPLTPYSYSVDSSFAKYRLTVTLPGGSTHTSPGSNL